MNAKRLRLTLFLTIFLSGITFSLQAQFIKDLSQQLQIQQILDIDASETHLYVLSETEGLAVFRAHSDSLQWLYSSTGMQERGTKLESDIRFSYLYGDSRRLTVIEPTSVLGVYSSTILPAVPQSVKRIGNSLFIAMGEEGFGRLSLDTPASVDSELSVVGEVSLAYDLATDGMQHLYVLENPGAITILDIDDTAISRSGQISLNQSIQAIFLVDDELIGSSADGNLYYINSNGNTQQIGRIDGVADKIISWNALYFVRSENGTVWAGNQQNGFDSWKSDPVAGNYITANGDNFWIAEFSSVAPLMEYNGESGTLPDPSAESGFSIKQISDIVTPFPRPVLIPIELENGMDPGHVSFSYRAPFNNAQIRGQSFYWQPASSQTGRHRITLTATSSSGVSDSTSFFVDIRSFNSPPRFAPNRAVTVPVNEHVEFSVSAIDPDGPSQELIRYMGVDLPEGSSMNEQTGTLSWTPSIRQVGNHRFQVIATDQFGAASSQDFEINVIEISN